jgi:sugar lactone lactonase YvrE
MNVDCVVASEDVLGEGPCWTESEGRLYWFDIKRASLSWHEPESGQSGRWKLPIRASAAAAAAPFGLIAATEAGLAHIDTRAGALKLVEAVDLGPGFRSNDGKIDPAGRFWWSRMDDDGGRRPGSVFCTDTEGVTRTAVEGVHIPNTVACAPAGDAFYLADSKRKILQAYDLAPDGRLGEARWFADLSNSEGTPDGSAVDAEGFLWNAQWGGRRIVRYAPDGRIDRIVPLPVEQPTSCAFGGPKLDILFVTSAREGLSPDALAEQPLAGSLLAFRPGVAGLALPAFTGWRDRIS